MKTVTSLVLVLTIMVLLCLACTKKTPNVNDPTQPTVEIKVKKNGQYEVVPSALVPQSLDLMCVVTDQDGVLSVKLEFFGEKVFKCEVGNVDKEGPWLVKFPDSQQVTLQGDSSGQVSDTLPIYFSLPQPKCQTDAGEGLPLGGYVFKARCTGRNWNPQTNPVVKELELKIQ